MAQKLNLIKRCPNCSFNSKLRRGNDEFRISYQLNHENLHRSFFPNIIRVNQLRIDRLLKDSQKYNYIMTFDIQIIIFFLPSQSFLFNYQIKKTKTLCSKKYYFEHLLINDINDKKLKAKNFLLNSFEKYFTILQYVSITLKQKVFIKSFDET